MLSHYTIFIFVRFLYICLDFLLDILLGFSLSCGSTAERSHKSGKYESCAHVTNVLWKSQLTEFGEARMRHFMLSHERYAHPRIILEDKVTLMSMDQEFAIFARCDVECHQNSTGPFFYLNQFKYCNQIITIPLHQFVHFMQNEAPSTKRFNLTLISNTGRCGSTLTTTIFEKTPNTIAINEIGFLLLLNAYPNVYHHSKYFTRADLIKATIDSLCLSTTKNGGETNVVIKPPAQTIGITHELSQIYPQMHHLYLYRHPVEYVRSIQAIVDSMMPRFILHLLMKIDSITDFIMCHFSNQYSERACIMSNVYTDFASHKPITRFASIFAANMMSAQDLAQKMGIKYKVVSYHELTGCFDLVFPSIADHCGIELPNSGETKLPEKDSQHNSPFSKDNLGKYKVSLTKQQIDDVDKVLTACGLPDCDSYPIQSSKLSKILNI